MSIGVLCAHDIQIVFDIHMCLCVRVHVRVCVWVSARVCVRMQVHTALLSRLRPKLAPLLVRVALGGRCRQVY